MLRVPISPIARRLPKASGRRPDGHGKGPSGRLLKLRKIVTELLRHERLEGKYDYMDEARGYAEKVVQEAANHGDRHQPTMEMLDYWILEKDIIHKLFKVIVPRYSNTTKSATLLHRLPMEYPGRGITMAVLELRGNPWPPVVYHQTDSSGTLVNVLLEAAKRDYREEKYRSIISESMEGNEDAFVNLSSLPIEEEDLADSEVSGNSAEGEISSGMKDLNVNEDVASSKQDSKVSSEEVKDSSPNETTTR